MDLGLQANPSYGPIELRNQFSHPQITIVKNFILLEVLYCNLLFGGPVDLAIDLL